MQKQKILVTGSCGFIFSNFVRKLIYGKEPYEVYSIDKLAPNKSISTKHALNNIYQNKNHEFYMGDICDPHFINILFEYIKPDIVVHGAAETHVDNSLQDPGLFVRSNVMGTQVLLDAAVKHGVKKFLYFSTDEILGQLTSVDDKAWTEDAQLNPRNPYAASKASGELMVRAAHLSHGLNYVITRCSNNYGPRQTADKLLPKTIKCILNGEKIPLYGQGLQMREWTHVYDTCAAVVHILKHGGDNEIYNISSHQEFTNLEVVQEVCNVAEKGHDLISFIPDPRKSHDFRYSVDTTKLEGIGFKPQFKFKEAIHGVFDWYSKNQWWFK